MKTQDPNTVQESAESGGVGDGGLVRDPVTGNQAKVETALENIHEDAALVDTRWVEGEAPVGEAVRATEKNIEENFSKIDQQQARIEELEAEVDELEQTVDNLLQVQIWVARKVGYDSGEVKQLYEEVGEEVDFD